MKTIDELIQKAIDLKAGELLAGQIDKKGIDDIASFPLITLLRVTKVNKIEQE